jgi:spore germination cell wall hydrolase CwlJ-like protein
VLSRLPACGAVALACFVSACSQTDSTTTASIRPHAYGGKERECLARAMFFESHRSSREGLVAVGTVVMNRVKSDQYPETICGVVGQRKQFAPGVLSRKMNSKALPDVMAAADAVLAGERHPAVHTAKFFHTAGLKFPYNNMHYVLEAGGNAFYEKRSRKRAVAAAKSAQEAIPALAYKEKPGKQALDNIDAIIQQQR